MANTYKNIVITPNIGNTADPKIQFSGGNTTVNTDISMFVYPSSNGTLSFEGSAGQLFSITNDLSGSLFSVNDVSGIPSLEVFANGLVSVAPLGGNVVFGNTSELILSPGTGLYANGGLGTAGQTLHSNGTSVYWAADDDTNTTYDLLAIANTAANEGRIRLKDSANSNDDVLVVGAGGVTVSSNATAVLITSVIGDITAVTAGDGLTGGGSSGDVTLNVGAGTGITVTADAVAVNAAYIATITANNASFLGGVAAADYKRSNDQNQVDVTAPASSTGTWTSASNDEWGNPKFDTTFNKYTYADAPATLQFNIPAGMKSAWISQLCWSSGGYVDVHGVQAGGQLVFLRRINTRQTVENTDEGVNLDGVTITFAASGLDDYSAIRFTVQSGRFHLTGLSFSSSDNEGTEGVGMVHPAQISHQGAGSGLDADTVDGVQASAFQTTAGLAANVATLAANSATGSLTNTFTVGTASYFVANGNFGIGTNSPSQKLVVQGNQILSGNFYNNSIADLSGNQKFSWTSGAGNAILYYGPMYGSGIETFLATPDSAVGRGSIAMGDGFNLDALAFRSPSTAETFDGTTWTATTITTAMLNLFSAKHFSAWSGYSIPAAQAGVRFTWTASEIGMYTFINSILISHQTQGNNAYALLETSADAGVTWTTYIQSPTFNSWPGYSLIHAISNTPSNTNRIRLSIIRSGASNGNSIDIGQISMLVSYGGGLRLFDWDRSRNITFPSNITVSGNTIVNGNVGISTASPSHKLHVTGTAFASVDVRAPIFYDSNDTTYYTDPASTSRLSILNLATYGYVAGTTIHGQSFYQWDGASFRNPADHTPSFLIRQDNATTGINGFKPALALYNNNGGDQTTVGLSFVSSESTTGTPNSVTLAGIAAKKDIVGIAGGWTSGSLYFFVKELGVRKDGMFIHNTGYVQSDFSFRAPIFYDSNDTSFYLDPASTTTSLQIAGAIEQGNNIARPNIEWQATGASTGMVIFSLPGVIGNYGMVHMVFDVYEYVAGKTATVIIGGHNWNGSWYEIGCQVIGNLDKSVRLGFKDGKYCVVFGGAASTWTYGTIRLRKIHNGGFYNNIMDLGGAYTAVQTTTESFTAITADQRFLRTPGTFQADADIRAPIFYDTNNTAFYVDPASGSSLKRVFVDLTSVDPTEINGAALGNIYEVTTGWSAPGIGFGSGAGSHGAIGYGSGVMYFASENGSDNTLASRMTLTNGGILSVTTDVRAPIFYDTNNTAYYLDPASTSNLNTVQAVDAFRSDRFEDLAGNFFFREGVTSGTTRHLNLSDSNSDPSAISSDVGISWGQRSDSNPYYLIWTSNYNNGISLHSRLRLGWHTGMEIGAAATYGGTRFFDNAPGIAGTSELMSIGKSDSHVRVVNNLYSKIYYDIDNTAFYTDPAATSNLNTLNAGLIGWNSIVPVFGQRGMYLNELVDVLYQADKRFTLTNGNAVYFDGNFDSAVTIPVNTTRVININIAGQAGIPASGITYCSGVILISFYYTSNLYSSLSLRVRNNAGVWTSAATPTNISTNASFKVMAFTVPIGNYLTDIELTVVTDATNEVGLASINYYTDRWTTEVELPYVSKYLTSNYMFGSFGVKNNTGGINNLLSGTASSYLSAIGGSVGIGNVSPSYKLHVTGTAYASADFRAAIFYDSDNTGYYLDPNTTTNLNALTVVGTLTASASTNHYNGHFYYDAYDAAGNHYPHFNDGGNASGVKVNWRLYTGATLTVTHNWTTTAATFNTSLISSVDSRAPIFYDQNNTAYYVDPATGTNLNGTFINNGGTAMTGAWNRNLLLQSQFPVVVFNSNNTKYSGIGVDHSDAASGFRFWVNGTSTDISGTGTIALSINTGNFVTAAGSFRAPIFYDSNDTTYYVDPAGATSAILNGNVGIGNTAPAHKLRVTGDISLSGGIHANGSLGTAGLVLTSNGSVSYWANVDVATISGVLPIAKGGTNSTATPTQYGIAYGTGTAIAYTAEAGLGQFLMGLGNAAPPQFIDMTLERIPTSWVKQRALVATTTNIATLSGNLTVDGVTLAQGNRVLVKNQTTASQNGIYIVNSSGAWNRETTSSLESAGLMITITSGSTNAGKTYRTDFKSTDTLASTAMNWYQVLDDLTGRSRATAMSILFG